jgi:pSer/pThr/pTyr-binding forkhead associated (FHA) protein
LKQPVVLRIYKADQLVGVKQFTDDSQIVIGSQADVQVPITDGRISSIHCAIESRDGSYYICDLGSESGTIKNNDTVLDAKLESGDVIKVGDHRIEFYIGVPKPKAPPTPATPSPSTSVSQPKPAPVAPPVMSKAAMSTELPIAPQIPEPPKNLETPVSAGAGGGAGRAPTPRTQPISRPRPQIKKTHKTKKTFAPPSKYQSYRDFVKPSKGTVVEVLVMWKERVINSYHFSGKTVVTMGSLPDCNIVLPVMLSKQRKVPLVKIESQAVVLISTDYTGELIKGQQSSNFAELARQNRMVRDANGYSLTLDQGEMVRIELSEQVAIIVRYTSDSPKPLAAPLLDLSASEIAGILMAVGLVAIIWLYTFLYSPPKGLEDDLTDDPTRIAKLEMKQMMKPPTPVEIVEAPQPTPPPTKATPAPTKTESVKPAQQKAQNPDPNPNAGKAANVAPAKKDGPRDYGSTKQGGAVKRGPVEGAQAKSERRDVKKFGAASVFGGGGKQNETATSYSGAGELTGMANSASGRAGQNENRAGEGLGSALKETGRGGTGTAQVGIAGGDPKGRGSGMSGYGTGGLGKRTGVSIVPGGNEESFSGLIDREAIRRVIQANLRSFRTCYERQLNRNPDLVGKVVIEWTLGEQGRVLSARVKGSEVGGDVAGCVRDHIRTLRFPEPPTNQEVTVVYPFYFSN